MQPEKVGIREFRENLATYLESSNTIAITRHGETVGYYIPVRPKRSEADLEALRKAAARLDALLAAHNVTEEDVIADFKALRANRRREAGE